MVLRGRTNECGYMGRQGLFGEFFFFVVILGFASIVAVFVIDFFLLSLKKYISCFSINIKLQP